MDNEEIEERIQRDDLCKRIANNDLRLRDAARALGVTDQRMRVHVQNWRERHPGRSGAEILSQVLRGDIRNYGAAAELHVTVSWVNQKVTEMRQEVLAQALNGDITISEAATALWVTVRWVKLRINQMSKQQSGRSPSAPRDAKPVDRSLIRSKAANGF
jgi:transposase-like protein